jgi:DNA polymerase III delta prime subunit
LSVNSLPLYKDFRPVTFDTLVGQELFKTEVQQIVQRCKKNDEVLPDMLLSGPPGVGKTTGAYCVFQSYFGPSWKQNILELNGSDDRGIDVVREKIKPVTLIKGRRGILLDEADKLTEDAQTALRRVMENSKGTFFILTANEPWRLIEAIRSRCAIFPFSSLTTDQVRSVIISVCKAKGVKTESSSVEETRQIRDGLEALIKSSGGDVRQALMNLEKVLSETNSIRVADVVKFSQQNTYQRVSEILQLAVSGDFERAKNNLEEVFILGKYNANEIIMSFNRAIGEVIQNREIRIRLYDKLASTEVAIRQGNTPMLQLVAFLSVAWIAPHLQGVLVAPS